MWFLNIFTLAELVAITMVLLQLILVTVTLRDKRLWRIRRSSKHPSAVRGRLEGQSGADGARRSADTELAPGSSTSCRRRSPRFIRSCRDSQALFEEHRKELEAQLAQWPRMLRGRRAAQDEAPAGPGLLGGKESPQGPAEERAKAGTDDAAPEDNGEAAGRGGGSHVEREQGSSWSTAMAWFVPRDVVIAEAAGSEGSGSGSGSSSSLGLALSIPSVDPWWGPALPPRSQPLPAGREPGWALGKLRARLGGCLAAWCSRRLRPCCQRRR